MNWRVHAGLVSARASRLSSLLVVACLTQEGPCRPMRLVVSRLALCLVR